MLNQKQQEQLKQIAKQALEIYVQSGKLLNVNIDDKVLSQDCGAFVTLHSDGHLRGCIGQITPSGDPLWKVIRDMAIAAGTDDPRFSPVSREELSKLNYEISVLSQPERITDWRKIELGKHGVIVKKGYQSGVFLPQVAVETNWNLEEFLSHLCADKAGLPADCFCNDPDVELYVFTAQVF